MDKLNEVLEISFNDFDTIKDILYESKLIEEKLFNLENAALLIKDKLRRNKIKIFIKKEDNIIVGFSILHYKINPHLILKCNWHISYLYVKKDFRRKYIGREIIAKCIDYARKNNIEHISLNTDTQNYAAQMLYESFGFVRKNYISNYYYYEMKLQ
jgi:ribosomal protein S18 acetylase RimI-like enzyme